MPASRGPIHTLQTIIQSVRRAWVAREHTNHISTEPVEERLVSQIGDTKLYEFLLWISIVKSAVTGDEEVSL